MEPDITSNGMAVLAAIETIEDTIAASIPDVLTAHECAVLERLCAANNVSIGHVMRLARTA
jgi:hypothetical protein